MSDQDEAIKIGVMCYLHLWVSLHKHVQLNHDEIANGIAIWDDRGGGYFAAFTLDNKRLMQAGQTYVCALSDDGPMVGQLDKIPPCTPVMIDKKAIFLLNAIAQSGGSQSSGKVMQQIDVVTSLIASDLSKSGKTARALH